MTWYDYMIMICLVAKSYGVQGPPSGQNESQIQPFVAKAVPPPAQTLTSNQIANSHCVLLLQKTCIELG